MSVARAVFANTGYIIISNFLNKLISLFILFLLTHYLDVADFGRFSFVIFYITFFGIFTDLGLNAILVRECSRVPGMASKLLGNGIIIKLTYTLLSTLASYMTIVLLGYPSDIRLLVYIASIMLFISFRGIFFRQVFEVVFQARLKMKYPSAINVLNELLTLGVIVVIIAMQGTLLQIILAVSLANLPGFLAITYFSVKLVPPTFKIDWGLCWRMIKEALPVGISGLLESLVVLLPVIMLSKLADDSAVGHYSLAFRLASSLWIIPTAFMMSLFPFMSQYAQESSRKELKEACLSGLKYMTLLAIPVAVLVTSLAPPIIRLISGSAYEPAAIALQFLIWGTSLYFLNTVFFYTFIAANLQRRNLLAWGIISTCTLVSTIILIPYFDFKGAAIAVVLSLLAGFFTYVYTAMRMLLINPWRLFVKCFIAGIIMELIILFSKESHLIAGSIFAFGLYIFTIIFLKVLNKEDYTIIRGLYARQT